MVNEELRGNWRDIFKVVKFSFDPKKIFLQMLGLIIGICCLLIFTQLGCLLSNIECGIIPKFFSKEGILLNLPGTILLIIGFFLFYMVMFTTNGMVSKMAVESFLRDEIMEINEALKYGLKNFKSFVLSPIVLVILIAFTFLGLYICGLIGRIPYLGEIVISFSVIPIFLGGLLILFLLLVFSFGILLLPSIIAVEDDDTFGAVCDLFFVVISNFWRLIGYEIIFKFVCTLLTLAVISIAIIALYLGGVSVMAGMGDIKFFTFINAFSYPSSIFLKIFNVVSWIFIGLLGLYALCIPLVYSNLANTIIYCNLEDKIKLAREEEKEEEEKEEEEKEKEEEKEEEKASEEESPKEE
jgi:signal transduction histidine kinase